LLDFAKPVPEQQEAVRLRDTVGWVLDLLRREIEQGKVVVTSEIPDDLPPVLGDVAVFREILLNLLLNAFQAGGEGSKVMLRAAEGVLDEDFEHFVSLSVEDDGAGVPPEIREKIFQPFFTTRQRGTGLGLAIVKRNVEHLGGQIHVESPARAGRGTRFLIHLPVAGPASESP
jgi:signal transduction histidine kinase